MTSIVITPFDSEHAEEYKGFIENELDNADFTVDMPASVELLDLRELRQQRDQLLASVKELLPCIDPNRDWDEGKRARAAVKRAESQ